MLTFWCTGNRAAHLVLLTQTGTVVKWTEDVVTRCSGETREIDTLNVETFHSHGSKKDGDADVIDSSFDANGGHFGAVSTKCRNDFLQSKYV